MFWCFQLKIEGILLQLRFLYFMAARWCQNTNKVHFSVTILMFGSPNLGLNLIYDAGNIVLLNVFNVLRHKKKSFSTKCSE